jgi:bacillithiol synthase
MTLPFSKFPGYNTIYLDYIYEFEKLKKYYEYDFVDKENIFKAVYNKEENYLNNKNFTRNDIADILTTQNKYFGSADETYKNIEFLRQNNTFAVVTGQQVGLLCGNYYTVLKAINTYQICKKYKFLFPEYNFVPVFWLESDDHDFLEINNISLFNKNNHPVNLKYFVNGIEQEKYLSPANNIVFDDTIEKFKSDIRDNLVNTEFSESLFNLIDLSYKPGIDMTTAFATFMNSMFVELGIIFCNPSDKEIKKLLKPIFEKELNTFPRTCEYVIETSAVIEQNYEPQVKPKPINLFYVLNGSRYLIEPRNDNIFALKNSRQKFTSDELFGILESNPELFSSNVILRPICQDYILPTVTYVGGPSEIAYFAQLRGVYKFYDMKMPVIYPRTSITFLESRIASFLNKFDISVDELFDEQKVTAKLMSKVNSINVDNVFNEFIDGFNGLTYSFSKDLEKIDKNLVNVLKNRNEKYIEGLQNLKNKFIESQAKQNESSMNKLKSAIENIYPDETLQERKLNFVYYINKYGPDIVKDLINKLDVDNFNHQLIDLNYKELSETVKENEESKNDDN